MAEQLLSADELERRMECVASTYHLVDVRHDRLSYYALTQEELNKSEYWLCISGKFLNLVMDGELDKAMELINSLPSEGRIGFLKLGCLLVHPQITWKEFKGIINSLKSAKCPLVHVILTAGRPSVLNGFNDFTRLGPLLESRKELFVEDLSWIYEKSVCPAIYDMCLAEYYYQLDRTFDAEVLVSKTIKEFDRDSERRLLFAALSLQTKILIAQGKSVNLQSYIKNIRKYVRQTGEAEFYYNLDAAKVMTAFYEGDNDLISRWLKDKAPDEFADFNMLDLFRYMVKMRCYIIEEKYTALVALAEKLRPLLEAGKRHMDLCEIDLLLAICFYRAKKKELAFEALGRALRIARRRKYYRLVGDEGEAILNLLVDYIKEKGETDFLVKLVEIARSMAINYPLYLTKFQKKEALSQRETEILKLLEQGKSKEEISAFFFVSENTVKYHMKNIYTKLDSTSALQAIWKARIMGII